MNVNINSLERQKGARKLTINEVLSHFSKPQFNFFLFHHFKKKKSDEVKKKKKKKIIPRKGNRVKEEEVEEEDYLKNKISLVN